jgi:hypothetical protein
MTTFNVKTSYVRVVIDGVDSLGDRQQYVGLADCYNVALQKALNQCSDDYGFNNLIFSEELLIGERA